MRQLATHFNHLKYNSQFGKQKSINKYDNNDLYF